VLGAEHEHEYEGARAYTPWFVRVLNPPPLRPKPPAKPYMLPVDRSGRSPVPGWTGSRLA
jgi:hypothetical protein